MAYDIFSTAAQNLSAAPVPSFDQVLAQTNPTGISLGAGPLDGTTQQSGTGIAGTTLQSGGTGYAGTPSIPDQYGNYTPYGTAATGTGTGNTADIAAYQDQINSLNGLLGRADTSLQNGTNSINRNFGNGQLRLQDQLNGQNQKYDQQQGMNDKGYQGNLNTINSQARNGYNSLQALLGGTGSAGEILAPAAVSQDAGAKTQNASDSYAQNLQALGLARKDAKQQYDSSFNDLQSQKNSKLSSLINSIDNQKIAYQQQIGQANNALNIARGGNYQTPTAQNDAIAALMAQQDGLDTQFADPTYQMQNITGQDPTLASYQAKAAQVGSNSNQPVSSGTDPAAAFLAMIQKQQQNNQYSF